jgi:PAS domain S-box-containing protein
MAEAIPVEDQRLEQISEQLVNYANADFSHELVLSDKRDQIDSIMMGLNLMGEELKAHIEEARQREEKSHRLAAIVESSSDAIISKTLDGYITSWNKRAEELFGYTEKEIIGKHVSLLFPTDLLNEEEDIIREIRKGRPIVNYETRRKRKDGTEINVAITISPVMDSKKNIIGVSKVARDITEKKLAEERLQKYTQELEYKNKETQQFSFIASHDLQEPLRTITNYINLLAHDYKGKLDGNANLYIDFISKGASRMQVLIHDLLEYTLIENDTELVEVDCNILLKEILENMKTTLDENHAVVKVDPLPILEGHRTRLSSLFQNLVSNAIKFRKKDVDPVIQISAKDKGKSWLFTIADNGIGIEEEYYDKIFKLFQRLHARSVYSGTGIGLAHCKKIVELRGGKIWVESVPGTGSTFYISLPKKIIK